MQEIELLFSKSKKYKNAFLQKKFKSKKNTVAYVTLDGKPRVLKWFIPGLKSNMQNELETLKKCEEQLQVPYIYESDKSNNVLLLNYIIGYNLCDIINSEKINLSQKNKIIQMLAAWFLNFHNFFKNENDFRIHGDATLRNFIYNKKLWGVDFEESRNGKPIEDIAEMCSSILTTDPMFTQEKFQLSRKFVESYIDEAPGRIGNINEELSYSILKKIQWRPDQEEILRKNSKKIKLKGIF
jgi:tRNA A-37 threonylcarbamoyl transferase component Bud32